MLRIVRKRLHPGAQLRLMHAQIFCGLPIRNAALLDHGMTARGKIILTILILGIAGFGAWKWWDRLMPRSGSALTIATSSGGTNGVANTKNGQAPELADFMAEVPALPPPAAPALGGRA